MKGMYTNSHIFDTCVIVQQDLDKNYVILSVCVEGKLLNYPKDFKDSRLKIKDSYCRILVYHYGFA